MSGRLAIVGALFVVSFMWPSEGAVQGDGLHWAILWMVAAAICCWQVLRSGDPAVSTSRKTDVEAAEPTAAAEWNCMNALGRIAPFVIVAGVWISTAYVFNVHADRRAALNVAFEWTAIFAASVVFWQWSVAEFRQQFGRLVIGLALGFAIMGIFQHHVVWAERAEWYLERLAAVENWEQTGSGAAQQAEAELRAEQVPLTGKAAETFRRRLLDSTEAIGPFALANTLGGFLASGLVLLIGCLFSNQGHMLTNPKLTSNRFRVAWRVLVLPMLWAIVIGYALVLTKSRTAWVATAFGVCWLVVGLRKKHVGSTVHGLTVPEVTATGSAAAQHEIAEKQSGDVDDVSAKSTLVSGKLVLAVCCVAVGLIVVGMATGAIDREVLLESPKSLQYRLMYWMGTLDLLTDHVLFGAGPGNFRNTYLQDKLPEASEQILDPHNLPLDTYSSAGLVGLIGLLALIVTAFAGSSVKRRAAVQSEQLLQLKFSLRPFFMASGFATGLFVIWKWFNGTDMVLEFVKLPDGGLLALTIPAGVVLVATTMVRHWRVDRLVFQAALATLLLHLMGAGAFQVTAVGLMLVCLHRGSCNWSAAEYAIDSQPQKTAANISVRPLSSYLLHRLGIVGFGFMAIVTVVYGVIPVRAAQQAIGASRRAEASGRVNLAVSVLEDGIAADRFNVKLRQRKAELLAYSFTAEVDVQEQSAPNVDSSVETSSKALAACDDWELADSTGYLQLIVKSRVLERLWKLQGQRAQLLAAIDTMSRAVKKYPTNAEFFGRLALLQNTANLKLEAAAMASAALKQDEINRTWGHAELYLDVSLIHQLNQLLK